MEVQGAERTTPEPQVPGREIEGPDNVEKGGIGKEG